MPSSRVNPVLFVLAVAFCFVFFGIGGLVLSLYFLVVRLVIPKQALRERHCRFVVGKGFGVVVWLMRSLGIAKIEFDAAIPRSFEAGRLVIANHPSLVDIVMLVAFYPQATCVIKQSIWRHPAMGFVVRSCGYIPNGGQAVVLEECAKRIRRGEVLIIFPEGSRTTFGESLKLTRGAANIALEAKCQVEVLHIDCIVPFLTKEVDWKTVPSRKPHFYFSYLGSINTNDFENEPRSLLSRQITRDWTRVLTEGVTECQIS